MNAEESSPLPNAEDPTLPSDDLNDAQLAEAKEYNRRELFCDLADRGLDLAYLSGMAFVLAKPIDTWLESLPGLSTLSARLAVMYVIVTVAHAMVSFPLSLYSGHILEHQFQMSRQTFGAWLRRYLKRNGLPLAFGLVLTQGLYWMIWLCGPNWWIVAAAGYFVSVSYTHQTLPTILLV